MEIAVLTHELPKYSTCADPLFLYQTSKLTKSQGKTELFHKQTMKLVSTLTPITHLVERVVGEEIKQRLLLLVVCNFMMNTSSSLPWQVVGFRGRRACAAPSPAFHNPSWVQRKQLQCMVPQLFLHPSFVGRYIIISCIIAHAPWL